MQNALQSFRNQNNRLILANKELAQKQSKEAEALVKAKQFITALSKKLMVAKKRYQKAEATRDDFENKLQIQTSLRSEAAENAEAARKAADDLKGNSHLREQKLNDQIMLLERKLRKADRQLKEARGEEPETSSEDSESEETLDEESESGRTAPSIDNTVRDAPF